MLAFRTVTSRLAVSGRQGLQGLLHAPDIDQVLAVLAFIALLVDPLLLHKVSRLTPVMGVLAAATALLLVARRRFPLGVLAIEVPLLLGCLAVFHPNRAAVGIVMLLVFTVGLEGGRARSLVVGALMAPVVTAAVLITARTGSVLDVIAYCSLVLGALLAGEALRARQALGRALVVDDHSLVRAGFRSILSGEDDIQVVGEAKDGAEAVAAAVRERPDVLLMDIRMPGIDGLEATRLVTAHPQLQGTKVVVLTTFDLDEYVFGALKAGASAFLLKGVEPPVLIDAVRTVAAGEALLEPSATRRLIEAYVGGQQLTSPAGFPLPSSLTPGRSRSSASSRRA